MLKKYSEFTSSKKELLPSDSTVVQNILNYSKSLEVKKTIKKRRIMIHLN